MAVDEATVELRQIEHQLPLLCSKQAALPGIR